MGPRDNCDSFPASSLSMSSSETDGESEKKRGVKRSHADTECTGDSLIHTLIDK